MDYIHPVGLTIAVDLVVCLGVRFDSDSIWDCLIAWKIFNMSAKKNKRFGLVVYFFFNSCGSEMCFAPPCEFKGLSNMTMVC